MALIECKKCHKTISDKAIICPHCGYKKNSSSFINYSLIGWILIILGSIFSAFATLEGYYRERLYYAPLFYIIVLILGISLVVAGGILISKKNKKAKKRSYIAAGVILVINIIVSIIGYHNAVEYHKLYDQEKEFYCGTWEYIQPDNQDGIQSVKFNLYPHETVHALINVKGVEIPIHGEWNLFIDTDTKQSSMSISWNIWEKIQYEGYLRAFKGYNDYFDLEYGGQIKNEDGKTYLYDYSDNPNKRVEITKIN